MKEFVAAMILTVLIASTVFCAVASFGAVCYRHGAYDYKIAMCGPKGGK